MLLPGATHVFVAVAVAAVAVDVDFAGGDGGGVTIAGPRVRHHQFRRPGPDFAQGRARRQT
eukprot:15461767-Alexandrium_andersonii.AAC.1